VAYQKDFQMSKEVTGIAIAVIGAIGVFSVVFGSWYTVPEGYRGVVMRNGAVIGTAEPGLGFKMPLIDGVHDMSVQSNFRIYGDDEAFQAYSRDQQTADIVLSVSYRIPPDQVETVYSVYGGEAGIVSRLLDRQVNEEFKNIFGQFNAVTAIQDRTNLNARVQQAVQAAVDGPIIVESIQIEDISFSAAYEESIEQRMLAEVEVQRVQQNAEREQVTAEITVIQAQAQADSQLAIAKAEAEAMILRGNAEAEAIAARGQALRDNPELVALTTAEKWNGILPTTMVPGDSVPFIDVATE
jgi:regulator of protease activity HflC (stomatin/prohibitin superfamily)